MSVCDECFGTGCNLCQDEDKAPRLTRKEKFALMMVLSCDRTRGYVTKDDAYWSTLRSLVKKGYLKEAPCTGKFFLSSSKVSSVVKLGKAMNKIESKKPFLSLINCESEGVKNIRANIRKFNKREKVLKAS